MCKILSECQHIYHNKISSELPPLRSIEHAKKVILRLSLANLPPYHMNAYEHIELK